MAETLQIRLSPEEQERFKKFALEAGLKHGEAFTLMLNTIEAEKTSKLIPDMADRIADFNGYVSQIQHIYTETVQAVAMQKDLAKEAVRHQIESKDETIRDLQTRLAEAEERAAKADALAAELEQMKKDHYEAQKTIVALSTIRDTLPDLTKVKEQQQRIVQLEAENAEKDRTIKILTAALQPRTKETSD